MNNVIWQFESAAQLNEAVMDLRAMLRQYGKDCEFDRADAEERSDVTEAKLEKLLNIQTKGYIDYYTINRNNDVTLAYVKYWADRDTPRKWALVIGVEDEMVAMHLKLIR